MWLSILNSDVSRTNYSLLCEAKSFSMLYSSSLISIHPGLTLVLNSALNNCWGTPSQLNLKLSSLNKHLYFLESCKPSDYTRHFYRLWNLGVTYGLYQSIYKKWNPLFMTVSATGIKNNYPMPEINWSANGFKCFIKFNSPFQNKSLFVLMMLIESSGQLYSPRAPSIELHRHNHHFDKLTDATTITPSDRGKVLPLPL